MMDAARVASVREQMERAEARRLQPNYIEEFFIEAFTRLGGTIREREPRRYEVTHVPAPIRQRDRVIGRGEPVLERYERVTFEKGLIEQQPIAAFICPGHPLLDATLDLTLERSRDLLRRGTILVDDSDPGMEPRVIFYAEHAVQDASLLPSGERRTVSKRMLYVELDTTGNARHMQYAPYLDFRPLRDDEPTVDALLARPECTWVTREIEQQAMQHAVTNVVPEHVAEVRDRRIEWVTKTRAAVRARLTQEISHWDNRAIRLAEQEAAGRTNARLNAQEAGRRADDLQGRLDRRLAELDREAQVSSRPPVVLGGLMVVPAGLIAAMTNRPAPKTALVPDRQAAAARARRAIMQAERELGYDPADCEFEKLGYDIESRDPRGESGLRFIEVKGRVAGAETVTVTKNEILYSLNKPENFILALVEFLEDGAERVHYLRRPFRREPGLRSEQRELRLRGSARPRGGPIVTQDAPAIVTRKKLIEVALPLDAINEASKREKSIRHGHPSTLHLWWARRPLAAARAVIFAQMVDDPSDNEDLFPTKEETGQRARAAFRHHPGARTLGEHDERGRAGAGARRNLAVLASCLRGERRPPTRERAVRPPRAAGLSTTRSPEAAPCRWRRNGWGWRRTRPT